MAKKAYIGVDNVARKIDKAYIGINGTARRVKKIYVGVGGVARLCWNGGVLARYGTIGNLSLHRDSLAGASVGNYALFAGGSSGVVSNYVRTVDAYNGSLTHSTPTELKMNRSKAEGAKIGNYALFAGGQYSGEGTGASGYAQAAGKYVDVYDSSLTRTSATELSQYRSATKSATIGDYVIFFGGSPNVNSADAYNKSLTHIAMGYIPTAEGKRDHASATVGNYALFGGGR